MQLVFVMYLALVASAPDRPAIHGWVAVGTQDLDVKATDYQAVFLGRVTVYQNPADSREFAKMYERHVAILSERGQDGAANPTSGRSSLTRDSDRNYHALAEKKALERVRKSADVFAVVRWRTAHSDRLGPILDGPVKNWLLDATGRWVYWESSALGLVVQTMLTEPSGVKGGLRVIVGLQFALADAAHVVRIDPGVLVRKNKKENGHAKK